MTTRDDSVMMALSELAAIERARVDEEARREVAARAERARIEAEAKLAAQREAEARAEREREAHAARVAEAEARLRVSAEAAAEDRAAALRREIDAIRAEREAMRAALEERVAQPAPRGASPWALAFGLSSLVAASLAALLVIGQPVSAVTEAPHAATQTETQSAAREPVRLEIAPVIEAAPEASEIAAEPVVQTRTAGRGVRAERTDRATRVTTPRAETRERRDDALDRIAADHDDDDVLGGALFDDEVREAPRQRRQHH